MIALLRKDRPWMRSCIVGGVVVMTLVQMSSELRETWILPPTEMKALFTVGWIWGLFLGLAVSVFDEKLGTRELLEHRPLSQRRLHASRVLACFAVLAAWNLLPPLLRLGIAALVDDQAGAIRPELIAYVWLDLIPCTSACAIGLFVGAFPFRLRWRVAISPVLLYLLFAWIASYAEPGNDTDQAAIERSRWIFASLHLATALAFVLASFAICGSRRDVDRPLQPRMRLLGVGSTVITATLAMTFAAHLLEGRHSAELHRRFPAIVRTSRGAFALLRDLPLRQGPKGQPIHSAEFVDEEHRPRMLGAERIEERVAQLPRLLLTLPTFGAPRLHWRTSGGYLESGMYCTLQLREHDGRYAFRSFGKGPDGTPFAEDAVRVAKGYRSYDSGPLHLVFERSSQSLWKLDSELGSFVPLALPNGDTLIDVDSSATPTEFVGTQVVYSWRNQEFQPVRASVRSEITAPKPKAPLLRAQTENDLLSPSHQIFDAAGSLVFEHAYAPRTSSERWSAGGVIAWSFARPPVLSAAAHLGAAPMETENALIDPLVSGGRRAWLVALHLLFGALCAALALWRLRRLGADRHACWFWGVLTLLLGIAPLLASLCFERRRAWSRGPAIEPSVPPRIVSAPALLST